MFSSLFAYRTGDADRFLKRLMEGDPVAWTIAVGIVVCIAGSAAFKLLRKSG